jgi:hypothetical protein
MSPYRSAELTGLIAPDHRRRNSILLVLGGMLVGGVLAVAAPIVAELAAADECRAPRTARSTRTMVDARPRARGHTMGALTVICQPKCSSIIDNGEDLGAGHLFNRPVASGSHQLILHAPNGVAKTLRVEVWPEEAREVRILME